MSSDSRPFASLSGPEKLELIQQCAERLRQTHEQLSTVFIGQPGTINATILTLLCDGHLFIEGVPGTGKSTLVENIAPLFNLKGKIQQFRSDLLPGELIGSEVLEELHDGTKQFRFIEGPVFANILMADEINRATPRTQAALLQAMQEKRVAVNGKVYPLPTPFHVLATQNPIEQEGTYPLPEAQLDRFLMKISVEYPSYEAEKEISISTTSSLDRKKIEHEAMDQGELRKMQDLVRHMPLTEDAVNAYLTIVRSLRPNREGSLAMANQYILVGPGPRAQQSFALAIRARALMDGRPVATVDDVIALAEPILNHRMVLSPIARPHQITPQKLIEAAVAPFRPAQDQSAAKPAQTLTGAATPAFAGAPAETPATAPAAKSAPGLLKWLGLRR